jgi:hypothetical protein
MLNRLGIFDLFSYTLPGGIYLSALITALTLWPIAPAIPNLKLDASVLVILVTISYLIGLLVSPVKWTPWDRLFPSRKVETILEKLQHTYPEVTLKIRPNQWPVIQANTALEDREFSLSVDKLRATHIMLRSVSLALCVFAFLSLAHALGHPNSLISWLGTIAALGASALAAKGSRTFKSWTYHYTFELMIARVVKPEDFVERKS